MKSLLGIFSACLFFAALSACGPQVPTEAEIRLKITGTYCIDKYKLTIEDSTYRFRRFSSGIISSTPIREACKGDYQLAFENKQWVIHFNKDPRPQGIKNCQKTFVLWTAEGEFLTDAGDKTVMWDLFDEKPLTKGACED